MKQIGTSRHRIVGCHTIIAQVDSKLGIRVDGVRQDRVTNGTRISGILSDGHTISAVVGDDIACTGSDSTDRVSRSPVIASENRHTTLTVPHGRSARHICPDQVALNEIVVGRHPIEILRIDQDAIQVVARNEVACSRAEPAEQDAAGLDVHAIPAVGQFHCPCDVGSDPVPLDRIAGAEPGVYQDSVTGVSRDQVTGPWCLSADQVVLGVVIADQDAHRVSERRTTRRVGADFITLDYISAGLIEDNALEVVTADDIGCARGRPADRVIVRGEDAHAIAIIGQRASSWRGQAHEVALNQIIRGIIDHPDILIGVSRDDVPCTGGHSPDDVVVRSINCDTCIEVWQGHRPLRVSAQKVPGHDIVIAAIEANPILFKLVDVQTANRAVAGDYFQAVRVACVGTTELD